MNQIQRLPVNPSKVVAVLLADGWHYIVPGSFVIGPLVFGIDGDRLGFRFDEDDESDGREPTSLTGALETLLAVRQLRVRQSDVETIELPRPVRHVVPASGHPSQRGLN